MGRWLVVRCLIVERRAFALSLIWTRSGLASPAAPCQLSGGREPPAPALAEPYVTVSAPSGVVDPSATGRGIAVRALAGVGWSFAAGG